MVEIQLSIVISEMIVLVVVSVDCLREREAVFDLGVFVAIVLKVETDLGSNWGMNLLDGV